MTLPKKGPKLKTGVLNNSGQTTFIPSRDGKSVTVQTVGFPIIHQDCGYYWITTSQMRYISCPKCGVTLNRLRSITTFRGEEQTE